MKFTRQQIEKAVKAKGYKWFSSGDLNVNIVGVRNDATEGKVTNKFDDHITISYKIDGEWQFECYRCTTDPGDDWMDSPMIKKGCAILKPGQYRSSHKLRLHGGKYLALGQQNPVTVYRDANRDDNYNFNEHSTDTGLFGINIHRATALPGRASSRVNKWSAGCQVIASNDDWVEFLETCQAAREEWDNNFTYTLINSSDIK
jgi:flagellar hook-associated protein FlgK